MILMRTLQRTRWLRRSKRGPGRGLPCRRGPARPSRGASEDAVVPVGAPKSTMVVATRALPRPGETSALTFIKDWAPLLLLIAAYELMRDVAGMTGIRAHDLSGFDPVIPGAAGATQALQAAFYRPLAVGPLDVAATAAYF